MTATELKKIDWCSSPNKGLLIQPRKYFEVRVLNEC